MAQCKILLLNSFTFPSCVAAMAMHGGRTSRMMLSLPLSMSHLKTEANKGNFLEMKNKFLARRFKVGIRERRNSVEVESLGQRWDQGWLEWREGA